MTPEQIADLRKQKYNGTVQELVMAHSDLMIMRVKPDFTRPIHQPGQYCVLGLGYWEPRLAGCQEEILAPGDESKLARRSYSLSCSIMDKKGDLLDISRTDWLEFYIVLVRQSENPQKPPVLTPRLFTLKEGDRLHIGEKIAGHYTLSPVQPTDNVIFLGTGTGEAPHNYMTWELLRRNHQGRILTACCVRLKQDLAYEPTHRELMKRYPNYTYVSLTTREKDTISNKKYIQDLITSGELVDRLGAPLDPQRTHVFLCGNPKMIGVPEKDRETGQRTYPQPPGVIQLLEERGFTLDQPSQKIKGNIHYEEYW